MNAFIDPVEAEIAEDTRRDHDAARRRGVRVANIVERIALEFQASGQFSAAQLVEAKVLIGAVLCDEFYGNAAVDVPDWRAL